MGGFPSASVDRALQITLVPRTNHLYPLGGMAAGLCVADAMRMLDAAPIEVSSRQVVRDGSVVAVLRVLDCGGSYQVTAETFDEGPEGRLSRGVRPYTFAGRDEASAFIDDAVGTFTYLGCEVR